MKAFITAFLLSTCLLASASETIPANHEHIEYTGRIDFSDALAPRFSYSGVSIRAQFSGTSIGAILSDEASDNYYNIILDGEVIDILKIKAPQQTYTFAEGLKDTLHEIELFKRSELTAGKTRFHGLVLNDGDTLSPLTNKRNYFIEYIGNSITCGYGNEGANGETFSFTTENHYLTYAAITSRNFNARHMAVCRSGIGMYRNYGGPATGSSDCMHNLYKRTFLNDENPLHDFAQKPDLVCINLGTNDFSSSDTDSALYIHYYLSLIDTIQAKYGTMDITCLAGPMLSGESLKTVRNCLQYIADSATKKGKGEVKFFEMSAQTTPVGVDYHPTVAQHYKNAAELTAFIKGWKNWKISPKLISAEMHTATKIQLEFNAPLLDTTNMEKGLTVKCNSNEYAIASVNIDSTNANLLNIYLDAMLEIGGAVTFSYSNGNLFSIDRLSIPAIGQITLVNPLTETTLNTASVLRKGDAVVFVFNKDMQPVHSLNNFSVWNKNRTMSIDTFTINTSQLTLYINELIYKGDTVMASYSGDSFIGTDGIPLPAFTDLLVKNGSRETTSFSQAGVNPFKIYPNPASRVLNYELTDSFFKARISICAVNGQPILSQQLRNTKGQIDLSGFATGIYYVTISTEENTITERISVH